MTPIPYKCPVCDGTGKVSRPPWVGGDINMWMSNGNDLYPCNACMSTGVIWGKDVVWLPPFQKN